MMFIFSLISILVGILVFKLGYDSNNELVIILGGMIVAWGLLILAAAIACIGKRDEEKSDISKKIFDEYSRGTSMGLRYTLYKRMMNDKVNKDIQKDISEANRSSRYH